MSYFKTVNYKGTINSAQTKEFLVDFARTGCCDSLWLDVLDDQWSSERTEPKNMFKGDEDYGIEVRISFSVKVREKEKKFRLSDNPSVEKFVNKYSSTIYLTEY